MGHAGGQRAAGSGLRQVMSKLLTETETEWGKEEGEMERGERQKETLTHFRPLFALFARLLLKCFAVAYINQSGKTKRLPQAAQQQQQHWQRQRQRE